MNTNHKEVAAALKSATSALKVQFSKSPRNGGKWHWAIKMASSPTSKAEIEVLCAEDPTFEGWSFFTSKDGSTHGVYVIVAE